VVTIRTVRNSISSCVPGVKKIANVRARMADLRSKCKPNPRTGSCRTPGGPCAQQSLPVFGEWRRARDPSNVSHPPRPSGTARPWRARLAARVGTRWSVVPPHHCPLTGGEQRRKARLTDRGERERGTRRHAVEKQSMPAQMRNHGAPRPRKLGIFLSPKAAVSSSCERACAERNGWGLG
jgi:hypothetical protein